MNSLILKHLSDAFVCRMCFDIIYLELDRDVILDD